MAAGQHVLADSAGDYPDWVELHNTTAAPVTLTGWHLTDDVEQPKKWTFPAVTMKPGSYLVVFASGKNVSKAGAALHTSFTLAAGGGYLALTRKNGTTTSALNFPAQLRDVSYGEGDHFFTTATPGAVNSTAFIAVANAPKFSAQHGFFTAPFSLTLTSTTADAAVRYTLDGSAPTASTGAEYSAPLTVSATTVVRAAAFKAGHLPSPVITRSFLFLADVQQQSHDGSAPAGWPAQWGNSSLTDYGLDPRIVDSAEYGPSFVEDLRSIPTMSLVMDLDDLFDDTRGFYTHPDARGSEWERPMSLELLDPDGAAGFQVDAGIRVRGGASRTTSNPKHNFHILLRGQYGAKELNYPLFGEEGAERTQSFDLRSDQIASWHFTHDPNSDYIRDQFARETVLALGQPSGRGSFFHLAINGQYWGLYNTQERISAAYCAHYFGGSAADYDVVKLENTNGETSAADGTFDAWVRLHNASKAGLSSNAAYQKVQGQNPDGTRNPAYERLVDVDSLIAYMIAGIYQGINDTPASFGTQNNWFAAKSRRGDFGWRFFIHDAELSMYDVNDDFVGGAASEKPFDNVPPTQSNGWHVWQALRQNAEFRLRVADALQRAFFHKGPLTPEVAAARFRKRAQEIDRAIVGESARWGDSGGGFGGPFFEGGIVPGGGQNGEPFTRADWVKATYERELRDYFPGRSGAVLQQFKNGGLYPSTPAPEFSQFGGVFDTDFALTIEDPSGSGTIYYTLDGTDPRKLGGALARSARTYVQPIALTTHTTVNARVKNGTDWSALLSADFAPRLDVSGLHLTEIHCHPSADSAQTEFLELKNTDNKPLDLSGFNFISGITYTFPQGSVLAPGAFWLLVRDTAQFAVRYPGVKVNGKYSGKLSDSGDTLTLAARNGQAILSVTYDTAAPWPLTADGLGFSLVPANGSDPNAPASWRASSALGGSPGADDPEPNIAGILLNEITSDGSVELYNPSASSVDVSKWRINNDTGTTFAIPAGTTIAAGSYVAFPSLVSLLTNSGGTLALFSADGVGNLSGYSHSFSYSAFEGTLPIGRYVNSVGDTQFVSLTSATPAAPNSSPRLGDVVISEIHYHPTNGAPDFIELLNTTATNIALEGWQLAGYEFTFPSGAIISAHSVVVVCSVAPSAFRTRYSLALDVPIFGPATRSLQDNGQRLTLHKPTNITVDSVRYDDRAPWPAAAAGSGPSLHRLPGAQYSDEPLAWFASGATPGTVDVFNLPPNVQITSPEDGATITQPGTVALSADVSDVDGSVSTVEFFADGQSIGFGSQHFRLSGLDAGGGTGGRFVFAYENAAIGQHEIIARATDNGGAVSDSNPVVVTVLPAPPATGSGLLGEYFRGQALEGAVIQRVDPQIDFEWTDAPPFAGFDPSDYSVRWTGKLQPRSTGDYDLSVLTSGGVRVWLDDVLVIDSWNEQSAPTTYDAPVHFDAWQIASLLIEYFEGGSGTAGIQLSLSDPQGNKSIISESQLFTPSQDPSALGIATASQLQDATRGSSYYLAFATSHGVAPLVWTALDPLPAGLSMDGTGILSGHAAEIGDFRFAVRVSDATGAHEQKTMRLRVLASPSQFALPQVAIVSPAANARLPEGSATLAGNARHALGIARVLYSLNDGPWRMATGREAWSVSLDASRGLVAGRNSVRVQSIAFGGQISAILSRTFTQVVLRPLPVIVDGKGNIPPAWLGTTQREIGRQYSILATPQTGQLFQQWDGTEYSLKPTLTFTMTEGATLAAHFIGNPFPSRAGSYFVLLANSDVSYENHGFLALKLTPTGAFTATVRVAGDVYRIVGAFDTYGSFSAYLGDQSGGIKRGIPLNSPRYLTLNFVADQPDQITCGLSSGGIIFQQGIIIDPPPFHQNLAATASRTPFSAKKNPCPARGHYTGSMAPQAASSLRGSGIFLAATSADGSTSARGILADGIRWSTASAFDSSLSLPLYVPLYKKAGSLSGTMTFTTQRGRQGSGELFWARSTDSEFLDATAALYVAPAPGTRAVALPTAQLTLDGGGLATPFVQGVSLSAGNTFRFSSALSWQLSINPANGLATGSFPDLLLGQRVPAFAVANQRDNSVRGFFRSTGPSGCLQIAQP